MGIARTIGKLLGGEREGSAYQRNFARELLKCLASAGVSLGEGAKGVEIVRLAVTPESLRQRHTDDSYELGAFDLTEGRRLGMDDRAVC